MPKLFSIDNSNLDKKFQINNDYAKNYDSWRQKEELNKYKTKYGKVLKDSEYLSDESSDSSEEDEDGMELTAEFEKDFYKTLACLKRKDPKIYKEDVKFFEKTKNKSEDFSKKKSKKEKPLFLRDYERQLIVEREGKVSDSEEEGLSSERNKKIEPTYVEEQQILKAGFKKILEDSDADSDDESSLFAPKQKSKEQIQKEEETYKEWLKGQETEVDDAEQQELKSLRDFWNDPKLDSNEKFLRDYILNKKFLNKDLENDINYDDKIHDSDENLSEDENTIEKQEEFEHKYNFRFEEPDQEFIKRYPRTLENLMRKKDTRRSEKRKVLKKRKEEEKIRQQEELKQLKAFKRKEIEEKIEKLKEITGNNDIQLDGIDLEGDFDPEEHDKKMKELFNDKYYADDNDENKPEFPEIDQELEIENSWDNYDPNAEQYYDENYDNGLHCEDPDFIMDADYDADAVKNIQSELIENTKKKKRKRRNKFGELIAKEKPKFDPSKYDNYQEYYDQYYSLDYEDMIGDLPCRFKYRKVVPNDYGLTVEEILMADDKELNKWCSLKNALQYKPEHIEFNDINRYKQKAKNENLKKKILSSLYRVSEEEENPPEFVLQNIAQKSETLRLDDKKKKKKIVSNANNTKKKESSSTNNTESESNKKKEKGKVKSNHKNSSFENEHNSQQGMKKRKNSGNSSINEEKTAVKRKKLKKKKSTVTINESDQLSSLSVERLKAYNINPKKFKNKLKYGKKN